MGSSSSTTENNCANIGQIPLVYHENYNIGFFGLENVLHSFDSKKYGKVFSAVSSHLNFKLAECYVPTAITESQLLTIHTKSYLNSLKVSYNVAYIAEVPLLAVLPNFLIQQRLLEPMRLATAGTLLASQLALEYGWSVNLSGGYHHAKVDSGSGFCVYADIPLAIETLLRERSEQVSRVLIVDLDAHQGNGFQAVHTVKDFNTPEAVAAAAPQELTYARDKRVFTLDMYNEEVYPRDRFAAKFITHRVGLPSRTSDKTYLSKLKTQLKKAIEASRPDIVFYNAGTDIFAEDPLGQLGISVDGIVQRDEMVFRACCSERSIPLVMTLSGGYTAASAGIISRSLVNLVEKGIIQLRPPSRSTR